MLLVFLTSAILTLGLAGTTLLHFVSTVFEDVSHAQSLLRFILDMSTLFVYAVLLAPSVVIFNMGCVVAGMEDPKCGSLAFLRSLSLLKGRRLQPALLLFLIMNAPISFMEVAFQYRVLRGATMTPDSLPALGLLEAPFLIFCHSFLLLFDSVVSVSFYRACQLEADTTKYCSDMEDADEDQFSIAIHLVEQRCRTMISIADSRPK
ncbi:hypothetical protein KP509_27G007600 [Ceratopteris richardii]|nr:hypothetical protein KP509_27G007600 [Ceratopteris richardii]